MLDKKTAFAGFATLGLLVLGIFGLQGGGDPQTQPKGVSSSGVIAYNSDLFWDLARTQNVTHIDWGTLSAGGSAFRTIFVVPGSDSTFFLAAHGWDPPDCAQFLTVTWNYSGQVLKRDVTEPVEISLKVSPDIKNVTVFRFNLTIYG